MIPGLSSYRRPIRRALVRTALAACLTAGFAGCSSYDGGLPYSADSFTYNSTPWRPYTVSLIDTRTGETLWLVDIPVEHTLKCAFKSGSGPNSYKPDMMRWSIAPTDRSMSRSRNTLPVPSSAARRLDVSIRPVPEFPDATPGKSPFTQPSQIFSQSSASPNGNGQTLEASNTQPGEEKTRSVPFVPIEEPARNIPVNHEEPATPPTPAPTDEPAIDIPD